MSAAPLTHRAAEGAGAAGACAAATHPASRVFLFLQGPQSLFFRDLGRALAESGAGVVRINICGADVLFWSGGVGTRYRFAGPAKDFAGFVERIAHACGVTDVLLYGRTRPHHRSTLAVAQRLGLAAHVFEEGILRPGWVSLSSAGASPFPSATDEASVEEAAPAVPFAAPRAAYALAAHCANGLLWPLFPRYRTHRPYWVMREAAGWSRRLLGALLTRRRNAAVLDRMARSERGFYLLALQLDGDAELRSSGSRHRSAAAVIDTVLTSFAHHAPASAQLVVKSHPLHNDLVPYREMLRQVAGGLGIAARVHFIDGGRMSEPLWRCHGLVTVSSTTGLAALEHGRPVFTLEPAAYSGDGLTFAGPLDRFWDEAQPPDPFRVERLRAELVASSQVRGNFYGAGGTERAVAGALRRMLPGHAASGAQVADPATRPRTVVAAAPVAAMLGKERGEALG